MATRKYGEGSVYQRATDGRWIGTLEAGWTAKGTRRRITVSAATEAAAKRKLRDKRLQVEREGLPAAGGRVTVKAWCETWLEMKVRTLRPKAYNAAASPVRKWIVPTIGHRRLDMLTPADVRSVERAQRQAGRKGTTAAATQRTLMNLLRDAIREGYSVPPRVLMTPAPKTVDSDRTAPTLVEAVAMLAVASELPHGMRWEFALFHGARQGECLGLTWEYVDLDAGMARLSWQLQPLPYLDRSNKALGFRVPDDFEARHLIDSWHLTRPKSRKGERLAPLTAGEVRALRAWREVQPPNPWGLVWPTAAGRPANDKADRAEWWALQGTACVGHPGGRYYHVHETRNYAATELEEIGASELVSTALLGHTSIKTTRGYQAEREAMLRSAVEAVAARAIG